MSLRISSTWTAPKSYSIGSYFALPDVGLSDDALRARRDHETRSAETIRTKLAPKHTTMKQVWMFMNQNHDLYTASKLIAEAMQLGNHSRDDALKASYGATSLVESDSLILVADV